MPAWNLFGYKKPKTLHRSSSSDSLITSSTIGLDDDYAPELGNLTTQSSTKDIYNTISAANALLFNAPRPGPTRVISALCMTCGSKIKMTLDVTTYKCRICQTVHGSYSLDSVDIEPLTLEKVKQQGIPLVRRACANIEALNASFPLGLTKMSYSRPGVNWNQVSQFYKLESVPEVVLDEALLLLKNPGKKKLGVPSDIYFILILLQNPLLDRFLEKDIDLNEEELILEDKKNELIERCCGLLTQTPKQTKQYLLNWMSRFSTKQLSRLVEVLNKCFEKRVKRYGKTKMKLVDYAKDWKSEALCTVLGILFNANLISQKLEIDQFYNEKAISIFELKTDFDSWEKATIEDIRFCVCKFPFLLPLKMKKSILEYDARRQMEYEVHEAFFSSLTSSQSTSKPYLFVRVRRSLLLSDSFNFLETHETELKKRIRVEFVGEQGIDAGGLRKEWFLLLLRDLFDPKLGLFTPDSDSNFYWFSQGAKQPLKFYKLAGVALGLALYNSITLDVAFPPVLYKRLLGRPYSLSDFKKLHPQYSVALQAILDFPGNDEEFLDAFGDMTYTVSGPEGEEIPLVPHGEEKQVTKSNRADYARKLVSYHLEESVKRQFEPLKQGFFKVAGSQALTLFHPHEIELLISGDPSPLNVKALRAITKYKNVNPSAEIVDWFWKCVEEKMDSAVQRKLLMFATGSDRIPAIGMSGMSFKFTLLSSVIEDERYPTAKTCFNEVCLVTYSTYEKLCDRLIGAIEMSEGFGLK